MAMNPRLLRPRASGFNPRSVSGLEGWWDAADASSVTLDSGRVSTWNDKSGNGRNAANSTSGSTQPDYVTGARNGRNVVRFTAASTQRLTVASSTAAFNFLHNGTSSLVIGVVKYGTTANPNAVYGFCGNSAGTALSIGIQVLYEDRTLLSANNGVNLAVPRGASGAASQSIATINPATVTILPAFNDLLPAQAYLVQELLIDADNATASNRLRVRVNGGAEATGNELTNAPSSADATHNFQLGAVGNNVAPLEGDICEVLIYSQQPTADAQTAIRRYLAAKWGVTLT